MKKTINHGFHLTIEITLLDWTSLNAMDKTPLYEMLLTFVLEGGWSIFLR